MLLTALKMAEVNGYFYAPTILTNIDVEMECVKDEIFDLLAPTQPSKRRKKLLNGQTIPVMD
jgi:succinate-semialdehyde dehydrogenase/glutarate-semialdehyde dehydrogenase